MRIVPRSRWGKGFMFAAIVLVAVDLMTCAGTLEWRSKSLVPVPAVIVAVGGGSIFAARLDLPSTRLHVSWGGRDDRAWLAGEHWYCAAGFDWHRGVVFPLWHAWLPAIILAALAARRHAKRSRDSRACKACGYDLTGLPPEALCPECGQTRA